MGDAGRQHLLVAAEEIEPGRNEQMLATGVAYLRHVGPTYGFFGLGLSLYFASQGAVRLASPLLAGLIPLAIAVGCGSAIRTATGSPSWTFASPGLALILHGAPPAH